MRRKNARGNKNKTRTLGEEGVRRKNTRGNKNKRRTTWRRRGSAGGRNKHRKNKQTYEYYLQQTGVRTLHTRGLSTKTTIRHRLTSSH